MTAPLEIAFYGSSLVSAYWNGSATYYRGIIRALFARGHNVTFYEPDALDRQSHRDLRDPDWARVVVYSGTDEDAARAAVVEGARSADILVKASGVGVFDAMLERAVLEERRPGQRAIFWDVDAPATLERLRCNPSDPFRTLIPHYDLILTYGGGALVTRGYLDFGARLCVPVYNALDSLSHHTAAPEGRFAADLSFLGNRLPDREARVDEFFLKAAHALPNKRFVLGGGGWGDKPVPPNVNRVGHVFTADHNAFNSSALAVLNVARDSMAEVGYAPATRIFEAAGAAACIVTDAWEGIELFLEPGKEILVASDGDDVVEIVRGLTPIRARAIGNAARRRILAQHTYSHRARQVEALLAPAPTSTVTAAP